MTMWYQQTWWSTAKNQKRQNVGKRRPLENIVFFYVFRKLFFVCEFLTISTISSAIFIVFIFIQQAQERPAHLHFTLLCLHLC